MHRICHVDTLPPIAVDGTIDNVASRSQHAGSVQYLEERRTDPLRDVRPTLFARQLGNLAAHRQDLEICKRKRCRMRHHAIDRQLPLLKTCGLMALELLFEWRYLIRERGLRDHAAR